MREQTEKMISAKLYIYIGVGSRHLFLDKAHTALDIFRFALFLFLILGFVSYFKTKPFTLYNFHSCD